MTDSALQSQPLEDDGSASRPDGVATADDSQTHTIGANNRESCSIARKKSPSASLSTTIATPRHKMTDDDALRIRWKSSTVDIADIEKTGDAADEKKTSSRSAPPRDESLQKSSPDGAQLREIIQSIQKDAYESILGMSDSSNRRISWGLLFSPLPDSATSTTAPVRETTNNEEVTLEHLLSMRYAAFHSIRSIISHCETLIHGGKLDTTEHLQILPPIFTTTTKVSLKQMLEAPHPWIITRVHGNLQLTVVDDRVASLLMMESAPSVSPEKITTSPTAQQTPASKTSKRKKKKKRKVRRHCRVEQTNAQSHRQQQATAAAAISKTPTTVAQRPNSVSSGHLEVSSNDGSVSSRSTFSKSKRNPSTPLHPPPPPPPVVAHEDNQGDEEEWEQVQTRRKKTPKAQKHLRKMRDPDTTQSKTPIKQDTSLQQQQLQQRGDKDQNTAPTYQETVLSKSTNTTEAVKSPSKLDIDKQEPPTQQASAKSPALPPLPRLLSPENASSATSSVASSLEPETGKHHHHVPTNDNTEEGYHLLDVCDRLSRDMSLFMSRRAVALNIRRRERSMLISKLQDTINTIWSKHRVQLYGSCATELDLPASDIDVVVMGHIEREREDISSGKDTDVPYQPMDNKDRIRRLAEELEKETWAVQVRAIPTATVPVIKVLADPSKLEGVQHQNLAVQAAAVAGKSTPPQTTEMNDFQQSSLLPWRGSDVMNGLLSLDITFEGGEHGGLFSTEFSALVVSQICAQTGLHPDATPFVQTLMVLKELLAQRKLNEPYSGGLSSYALLLLLLALVNERQMIREEINRFAQQKRSMAGGDSMLSAGVSPYPTKHDSTKEMLTYRNSDFTQNMLGCPHDKGDSKESSTVDVSTAPSTSPLPKQESRSSGSFDSNKTPQHSISSWAAIAKQPQSKDKKTATKSSLSKDPPTAKEASPDYNVSSPKQKSFADAVAGKRKEESKTPTTKIPETLMKPPVPDTDARLTSHTSQKTGPSATPPRKQRSDDEKSSFATPEQQGGRNHSLQLSSTAGNATLTTIETSVDGVTPIPCYPQGYNDIVEVLCSGEPTSGKLLMHFLLYYGQHFDAQSTAIDVAGKHQRDFNVKAPLTYFSPYIPRKSQGVIDPVTGMLTVDPIVVYEPMEIPQDRNVARRCFAWNSVKWIFAQSYSTLASAVERTKTPLATQSVTNDGATIANEDDPSSSSLLRCLLSF